MRNPRYLNCLIDTYTPISDAEAIHCIVSTFEELQQHLDVGFLFPWIVSWRMIHKKHEEIAYLQDFSWEAIARDTCQLAYIKLMLENIDNPSGPYLAVIEFSRRKEEDHPNYLTCLIDDKVFNRFASIQLQTWFVQVGKDNFRKLNGCTGYITYESFLNPELSPHEYLTGHHEYTKIAPDLREYSRGYYWGNFMMRSHLEKIGGYENIFPNPLFLLEELGDDRFYLQFVQNIQEITLDELAILRVIMQPILRKPNPQEIAYKNVFHLLLDEPQELYRQIPVIPSETKPLAKHPPSIDSRDIDLFNSGTFGDTEALAWLRANRSETPLAVERFEKRSDAIDFVTKLYDLGAKKVDVRMIFGEKWRIESTGGSYATSLEITLPKDYARRKKIIDLIESDLRQHGFMDFDQSLSDTYGETFFLSWVRSSG